MARKADEIRAEDMACIALDEFIDHRKKQVNGDKESLAYFDVIRTEAQILNRITVLQTKEDLVPLVEQTRVCKESPSILWLLKNKFLATFGIITSGLLLFYVVFHLVEYSVGFQELLKSIVP